MSVNFYTIPNTPIRYQTKHLYLFLAHSNTKQFLHTNVSRNVSTSIKKKLNKAVLIRYLWILVWFKQTVGLRVCFEPRWEALQPSRNNCQLPGKPWQKHVAETFRCAWWVVASWWVVVCTSAEVIANCIAQIGALNTAEPLSDGYTVQAQHGDIEHSQWMTSLRIWLINE